MNLIRNLPRLIQRDSELKNEKKKLSKKECRVKIKEMISFQNSEEAQFYAALIKKRDFTILTKEVTKNPQNVNVLQFLVDHSSQLAIRKYTSFEDGNFMDIALKYGNHQAVEILKREGLRRSIFADHEKEEEDTEKQLRNLFKKKDDNFFDSDEEKKIKKSIKLKKQTPNTENLNYDTSQNSRISRIQKNSSKHQNQDESASLLVHFNSNWSGKIPEDIPVLHCYVSLGKISLVKKMIAKGMDVNRMQDIAFHLFPRRPLHCAIDGGFSDIAKLLIKNGAKDCLAYCSGWWGKVKYKLPHYSIEENHQGITELTALHMAIMNEMPEIVKLLLENAESDVHQCASGLISPMHLAIKKKDTEMIQILLTYGGSKQLYMKDEFGYHPLDHMQMNQSYELLEVITPFLKEDNSTNY